MIRAIILAATAASLLCLYVDRPKPIKDNQVPYCVIDFPAAIKDEDGEWHTGWARGYGPCSLQDVYRYI